jgi:hypothetical protein
MQTIASNQSSAEVPINENFVNVLWAELYARNPVTTTGLTWGYVGGQYPVNGVMTTIAAGTVTLTNVTNFVGLRQSDGLPVVTATTANPLHVPLYTVVAAAGVVTSYTDTRSAWLISKQAHGSASQALTAANVPLTQAQALCETLVVTGALTAIRDLVVPLVRRRWAVRHTGTAFDMRVIGATGTGITIGIGKAAIVECDGTNVNRLTADV